MSRSDSSWMAFMLNSGPLLKRLSAQRSDRIFSSMLAVPAMPKSIRSSGTRDTPRPRILLCVRPRLFSPSTVIVPAFGVLKPKSMSTSSFWPFPSTPAIPRISPLRTSNDTLSSTFLCHSLTYSTSRTRSTVSVGRASSFWTFKMTSRPTISREISSFVTSHVL